MKIHPTPGFFEDCKASRQIWIAYELKIAFGISGSFQRFVHNGTERTFAINFYKLVNKKLQMKYVNLNTLQFCVMKHLMFLTKAKW